LPFKNGTEVFNELNAINNHPPILLFSAHSNSQQVSEKCKADGFIGKPFDMFDLLKLISGYIKAA
jgi:DNA-binding response OmpR family regulator